MKKRDRSEKGEDSSSKCKEKLETVDEEKELNEGFGDWLRSGNGVDMMRLFVIANSLLVFVTIAWPNMQHVWSIVRDYIMGEEEDE